MFNRLLHQHDNTFFLLLIIPFIFVFFSGCGSDDATKQLSAEERFTLGMKAFADEDYLAAIEEFKVVSLQYQGSNVADSAQFYMAECRYLREEYILAAFEYEVLLRNMPSSIFVSRSRFRRATCFYDLSPTSFLDQNYSRKAIDEYQAFLEYHPTDTMASLAEKRIVELNTKLAKKDYESGMVYMHMEYYRAATYYFDLVLDKYHDTEFAEPALFEKTKALLNRKKFVEAQEAVEKFRAKYPSSTMISDANQLRTEIEKGLVESKKEKQKKSEPIKDTSQQVPQSGS